MDKGRKGQIALKVLAFLAEAKHVFKAFEGTQDSYTYLDHVCGIERTELHSFGSPEQMCHLGLIRPLADSRQGEIANAIVKFEFGFNNLDFRGRVAEVAKKIGLDETEFSTFLQEAWRDFGREMRRVTA
jgi:hypothetical protein